MKNKKKIILIPILILFVSIGFALISKSGLIGGIGHLFYEREKLNIKFERVNCVGTAKINSYDTDEMSMHVDAELNSPGDMLSCTMKIVNNGDKDAYISNIDYYGYSFPENITNKLEYSADGKGIPSIGDRLDAGESVVIRLYIQRDNTNSGEEYSTDYGFKLDYQEVEADEGNYEYKQLFKQESELIYLPDHVISQRTQYVKIAEDESTVTLLTTNSVVNPSLANTGITLINYDEIENTMTLNINYMSFAGVGISTYNPRVPTSDDILNAIENNPNVIPYITNEPFWLESGDSNLVSYVTSTGIEETDRDTGVSGFRYIMTLPKKYISQRPLS